MYEWSLTDKELEKFKIVFRQRMIEKNLTYFDLALMTGYSEASLANFKSRKRKDRFIVNAIANALDISRKDIK